MCFRHWKYLRRKAATHPRAKDVRCLPDLFKDTAASPGLRELTLRVEHALDERADHRGISLDDVLEAITGDQGDELARGHGARQFCGAYFAEEKADVGFGKRV